MTVDCMWEIQKAVFTALDGDATLSGLVSGVYSHVPQDTAKPFLTFIKMECRDWSTKTTEGIRSVFAVEAYSDTRGSKEIHDILVEVKRVLHGASLAMTGCTMIVLHYNGQQVEQLADGLTWRGRAQFTIIVQKN